MYKKLLKFLKPHGKDIWLSALCSAGESLFALLIPLVMAAIMDKGVGNADLGYTAKNGLLMTGMALLVVVFGVCSMKFATRAGLGLGTDLRSVAYRKMQTFTFQNLGRSFRMMIRTMIITRGIRAMNIHASLGEIIKLNTAAKSIMLGARTRYLMA